MIAKDWPWDPNPMMRVRRESEMKAQIKEPPFIRPVIWAYPIGKAISHPIP